MLLEIAAIELAEQDLAVRRRVEGDPLADPVVAGVRAATGDLLDVERGAGGEDRDVDRLVGLPREAAADGPRLVDEVESRVGRAGEPQDAGPEAVLAPLGDLLDEVSVLECGDEPTRGALVDVEVAGQGGYSESAVLGEQLEDRHRAIYRLDRRFALVPHHATIRCLCPERARAATLSCACRTPLQHSHHNSPKEGP